MDPTDSPFTDFDVTSIAGDVTMTPVNDSFTSTTTARAAPPIRRPDPCLLFFSTDQRIKEVGSLSANRTYVAVPVAFVGIIMILLVNGKRMFKSSPYFYMCVLTIADTAYITMELLVRMLMHTRINLGNAGCTAMNILYHVTQQFAIGTLVVMTAERMLVVAFPFKFQNYFTVKKSSLVLGLLMLAVILFNLPYTWASGSFGYISFADRQRRYTCDVHAWAIYEISIVIYIKIYVFVVAPMAILFACNLVIISTMVKMVRTKAKLSEDGGEKSKGQLRHVTTQTLSVSIAFIVLCLPYALYFTPGTTLRSQAPTDCEGRTVAYIMTEVAKFLYSFQHCINGFVYCLCSAKFRKDLLIALHITKPTKSVGASGTRMTGLPSASASSSTQ